MNGLVASPWRWVPALCLLVTVAFWQTLDHGFHFDDDNTIVHNPSIQPPIHWTHVWSDPGAFSRTPGAGMYRPLLLATFIVNYAWSGLEGWSWHVVNVALHAGVSVLAALLAIRLGCRPVPSLVAGSLFALHPLCVEPVSYISSRSELLATAFLLVCLLGHIRSRQAGGTWRHKTLSAGALAAGLLCKATAATAPLLILAYELLVVRASPLQALRRLLPFAAILTAYAVVVRGLLTEALLVSPVRDMGPQLATQVKALSYYVRLLVLPHPLSVEHPFSVARWYEVEPLIGLLLLISCWAVTYRASDDRLRFLLSWPLLVLLPTIVIPLNVLVSEHRLYPVLAGLVPVAAYLVPGFRPLRPGVVGCVVLMSALTIQRVGVWASERGLWEDAVRWTRAPRPHVRLALIERSAGNLVLAENHLRHALEVDPVYAPAWNNLGNVQRQSGDIKSAEASYQRALSLLPSYPEAMTNLAALRVEQGHFDEGLALYERALKVHPNHDQIHNNIGTVLLRLERMERAEHHLRRALELGGGAPVWFNLSGALEGQDRTQEARDALLRAVSLDPTYAPAWLHLGNRLAAEGRRSEAHDAWRSFLDHWRGADEVAVRVRGLLEQGLR